MLSPMADLYIDQYETLGYGFFAAAQILSVAVGLDPEFDRALKHTAARIAAATEAMAAAIKKAGALDVTANHPPEGAPDAVATARDVLRRLIKYAESRPNGERIAARMLGGDAFTTVTRRRPMKLIAALDQAIEVVVAEQAELPEHASWRADLTAVRNALAAAEAERVRSREERQMTPEVAATRDEWLKTYRAAKLIVQGVLSLAGHSALMNDIFDDLADVHRVMGVTDDAPPVARG
jgi:hypothetical protein